MNERSFRFADVKEQVRQINLFVCISTTIVNIIGFIFVLISYLRGYRTEVYTFGILGIMAVTSIGGFAIYKKDKNSEKLRYFMLVGLLIITLLLAYGFNSYYMRVMAAIPFFGAVLFFDTKFSTIAAITVSIEHVAVTLVRQFVIGDYVKEQFMDNLTISAVMVVMMFVMVYLTKVGKAFNDDSIGKAQHEAEIQKDMMDDVLQIAERVRMGTMDAMNIVNALQQSSEVVSNTVGDISDSTSQTAESIQTQSIMTQNIQDNIEQTVTRAENMVRIAERSAQINGDSVQHIERLRQESTVLAETNETVAVSMKQLQQKVSNVKEITKTIFDISSQTNLLALNASIESARAGEAGRGFAVVADEIRALSERTRQETESISRILETLEENANETAKAVERSVEVGNVQEEMITEVASQFEEMNTNVQELVSNINEIEKMLDDLSSANTEIVNNITYLSATTEEVTASAIQSSEITEANFRNSQEAKDILDGVIQVSHGMDRYIK